MRITLDTNQLVRALMRPPQLATFVMAWQSRRFSVVASQLLLDEYQAVMVSPEVVPLIQAELLRIFAQQLIGEIEVVALPELPRICRDPLDDKVIATALYGEVDYLVTADEDFTDPPVAAELAEGGISLITAQDFIRLLDRSS
jgi:hypothetical protein